MTVKDLNADAAAAALRRAMMIALFGYPLCLVVYLNFVDSDGDSIPIDFVAFWAAAKLSVQGVAVTAFDLPTLRNEFGLPPSMHDAYFGWHYPPTFQLLISPLGWLPFTAAFLVFSTVSVTLFWQALRQWSSANLTGLNLAFASPAVLFAVVTGNVTLLLVAAMLTGVHFLHSGRALLAGLCFSVLAMKPQIALALPIALLAAWEIRAIFFSAVFALAGAFIAGLVFGWPLWQAFFGGLVDHGAWTMNEIGFAKTMVTWFGFVRVMDPEANALAVQLFWSALAGLGVAAVWSSARVKSDLKIAVLLLGSVVIAPRGYSYELVFAAAAILFIARAGVARSWIGWSWLALLWLLPLPYRLIPGLEAAHYGAPILTASFAICLVLAWQQAKNVQ